MLVIIARTKIHNSYLISLLFLNFALIIVFISSWIFVTLDYQITKTNYFFSLMVACRLLSLVLTFIYFKALINFEDRFELKHLWHFLVIVFICIAEMLTRNMAISEMALMNGNLISYTNYELNHVFTLHGFILNLIPIYSILYLFFSWRLWFTFFSKEKPNSITYPLMKKWGFAFLMFKSIAMFSFFGLRLIRQFGFDYLESSVSIFLSISSIIFSAYIIYNPDILSKISKINVKKRENNALEESKVDEIFKTLALPKVSCLI